MKIAFPTREQFFARCTPQATGESHVRAKLTAAQVVEIFESAESIRSLASIYGVDRDTIYAIVRGKNWRRVTAGLRSPNNKGVQNG